MAVPVATREQRHCLLEHRTDRQCVVVARGKPLEYLPLHKLPEGPQRVGGPIRGSAESRFKWESAIEKVAEIRPEDAPEVVDGSVLRRPCADHAEIHRSRV